MSIVNLIMINFFDYLLLAETFIPQGNCYLWQANLIWLHLISDALITIAYYVIPILLVYLIRQRQNLPFKGLLMLFGAFIICGGTTHLMELWTLWDPAYWLSGSIKAITAIVSVYTAIKLYSILPRIQNSPSLAGQEPLNQELKSQIEERILAEQSLRQREQRWQLALQAANQGIWDWNPKTNETFVSSRCKEMLGYDESYDIGNYNHQWRTHIHPDDLDQVIKAMEDHLAQKTSYYVQEYRLRCNDGSYKWILDQAQALWNEAGDPVRVVGSITDISDRKETEEAFQENEKALKSNEERLRAIMSSLQDVVWSVSLPSGILRYVNIAFEQVYGRPTFELFSDQDNLWRQFVVPEDFDPVDKAWRAVQENRRQSWDLEYRIQLSNGEIRWLNDRARVVRRDNGTSVHLHGITTDITERKQQEAQLQQLNRELQQLNRELEIRVQQRTAALLESEQRFRSLFESAPDFIHILDTQGMIEQVNPAVIQQSGYSESELIGNRLEEFFTPRYQNICQQQFPVLLDQGTHRQEIEFVCKNGTIITTDCSWSVVHDTQGNISYILVLQRDISSRKRFEQERTQLIASLQESERRWRSLLENVRLVVVGLDREGKVEYVNPFFLELTKYTAAEVLGKDWFENFLPNSQQQSVQQYFQDILDPDFQSHYQHSILTKSKQEKIIAWNNTLLQNVQGEAIGTMSIGEDITERYAIERMKDEFTSVVSHELRTPLTSIHGALNLLSTGLIQPQSERGQRVIGIAADSAERLVRLVNDILELERLESGKIRLSKQPVNAAELMVKAVDQVQVMANRAGIKLEVSSQSIEGEIEFEADSDRIIQVITNLLSNGIKFSDRGSSLWLTVELQQPEEPETTSPPDPNSATILFTVKDQGRGIPADKLESIFGRFQQVDASDARKKGGTGLGLAICRNIVEQHGGKIWVESTVGEGSSFYFTLPKQTAAAEGDNRQ
ncbi:PAS domain S-box protein [Moorena producens JHB]|uniref:Circadian input-output histidine kinase CikA n=1 Tax=Moorena producens (strain JHB) TaxID=1454205 RepID=A0A1D9FT22_MOOP1|nr:PAS domain S-box protein [Moorena producens]AOY78516.1 PAS domain S-box protein [Moorena producens JHB]